MLPEKSSGAIVGKFCVEEGDRPLVKFIRVQHAQTLPQATTTKSMEELTWLFSLFAEMFKRAQICAFWLFFSYVRFPVFLTKTAKK